MGFVFVIPIIFGVTAHVSILKLIIFIAVQAGHVLKKMKHLKIILVKDVLLELYAGIKFVSVTQKMDIFHATQQKENFVYILPMHIIVVRMIKILITHAALSIIRIVPAV